METVRTCLETEDLTAEREWTVDGIPVLTARITLPRPTGPETRITRRIRRYYRTQCGAYLRYCEGQLFPMAAAAYRAALAASAPLPHLTATLTYRVTYNEGGLWSLYTQTSEPEPDGHRLLRRWGDTWDLRTGYPASLSRFVSARGRKRRLTTLAAQEIQRQEAAGFAQYLPGWRRRLRKYFNPMNFYLTAEGLAFFYPMYAIAPAAEGIPTFLVPFEPEQREKTPPAV